MRRVPTYWADQKFSQQLRETKIQIGGGVNTYASPFNIDRSESMENQNTSSKLFPSLAVKSGRSNYATGISLPNGIGQRNNSDIHVVASSLWQYWNTTSSVFTTIESGVNSAVKSRIFEYNTEAKKYTVLANSSVVKAYIASAAAGSSVVCALTSAPNTPLYTVDDYRLYALSGSVVKCSTAGNPEDWTTASDADTIAITAMQGEGTAITTFNDSVIPFSEYTMHPIMGDDPDNFYQSEPIQAGCISNNTITQLNGVLYFLDYGKYKAYTGGLPYDISQKVKTYLEGINTTYKTLCCVGTHGKYIYLSIPYGNVTANNYTLEYDTELKTWNVWNEGYAGFVNISGVLYGMATTGKFYKINDGTTNAGTAISWYHITGIWQFGGFMHKEVLSNMWMVVDLPVGSTLLVYYSTTVDTADFTLLYTFTANANEQNTRIQVPLTALQSVNWYRLKFSGTGPASIHFVELAGRVKPR